MATKLILRDYYLPILPYRSMKFHVFHDDIWQDGKDDD